MATEKKKTVSKAVKHTSSRVDKPSSSKLEDAKSQLMTTWILILVGLQVILSVFIIVSMTSGSAMDEGSQISQMSEKVDAMDTFFSSYVDGYVSPTGGKAAVAAPTAPDSYPAPSGGGNVEIDLVGEPMLGNPDATVTIVEFSDYECPFCGRFFSQTYGQLKAEYIDTGKVNLVFKDFPLSFHAKAEIAAVAANCLQADLGDEKYFEFHDMIFTNQQALSVSNLKAWALEVGVEESLYDTCIADPNQAAEVQADLAEGAANGVSGTPSFFINGELIVGAQPYAVIKEKIESHLNG